MTAAELNAALIIDAPFNDWATNQIKAGKQLKPFFGTGKLGKNYRMIPELEA